MIANSAIRKACIVAVTLCLGGCLSDADTANNRSVLPGPQPTRADRGDAATSDSPRQLCESTTEAGEPKTICY